MCKKGNDIVGCKPVNKSNTVYIRIVWDNLHVVLKYGFVGTWPGVVTGSIPGEVPTKPIFFLFYYFFSLFITFLFIIFFLCYSVQSRSALGVIEYWMPAHHL